MNSSQKNGFFDPSTVPQEIWIDMVLSNHFSFGDVLNFGLVCHFCSGILANPKIQKLKFIKKTGEYEKFETIGYVPSSGRFVCWSPTGTMLASCGGSWILLWNTRTGKIITKMQNQYYRESYSYLDFHPNEKSLVASSSIEKKIQVFDISNGESKLTIHVKNNFFPVRYTPDGKSIVAHYEEAKIGFWDSETGQIQKQIQEQLYNVRSMDFNATGELLFMSSSRGAFVFNIQTCQKISLFSTKSYLSSVCLSPDGTMVAGLSPIEGFWIWDLSTYELKCKHPLFLYSVCGCFSSDSKHLLYSADKKIVVYSVATKKILRTIGEFENRVSTIALSPDGNFLVVSFMAENLQVIDLREYL